jgi:hypothetical protein
MVALRPIPCPDRTIGLSFYEIVSDQSELLANPDLPVFADPESARRSLSRGTLPPPGTTRVLSLSEIPPTARRRLPSSLCVTRLHDHTKQPHSYFLNSRWCSVAKDVLVVCDLPLVISAAVDEPSLPETLARFKCLPVLHSTTHHALLKTGRYTSPKKSIFWGLPCLTPRRFSRTGDPVRSPQEAILRRRDAWLAARAHFDPSPLSSLCSTIDQLLCVRTFKGSISELDPSNPRRGYPSRWVYTSPFLPRSGAFTPPQSEPTWRNILQAHLSGLSDITHYLKAVRTSPLDSSIHPAGALRSPLILLRRRYYPLLYLFLLEVAPLIPILLRPFPSPDSKCNAGETRNGEQICRELAHTLYTFMRSITPVVPGRSFLNPFSESLHVRVHPPVLVDPHDQPERDVDPALSGEPARPE